MNRYSLIVRLMLILVWSIISYGISVSAVTDQQTAHGLFLLILFAGLWMTEIIPLPVSALLVPVFGYLGQLVDLKAAMAPFSSTIIFLFMGGFTLAALLSRHNIDQWMAARVTRFAHGHLWCTVVGFFAVTTFLSMWMSNTSTTAMMLPIAISLIDKAYPRMRAFVILGTAYAANIGGLATAVGSPPNGIAVAALQIDFISWFKVGFPTTVIMFPLVLIALRFAIAPEKDARLNNASSQQDSNSMVWTPQAIGSVVLFAATVICWIFSAQIGSWLGVKQFDRVVAILVTALAPALGLIQWKELEKKIDWGTLILFGGGLCLSLILKETGTSKWIATELLTVLTGSPDWLIIIACITLMIILTEFASNTGSAAILIPVMVALSDQFNPAITYALVFGVGVAATCAFMLPVATPPNALAYGTGHISQKQMLKAGALLNLAGIFVVYTTVSIFS